MVPSQQGRDCLAMLKDSFAIVYIAWMDACQVPGWKNKDEIIECENEGLFAVESVGWLVAENDEFYMLAMSTSHTKAGDLMKIPKCWVTEVSVLSDDSGM